MFQPPMTNFSAAHTIASNGISLVDCFKIFFISKYYDVHASHGFKKNLYFSILIKKIIDLSVL